jgi:hypothetical protein
VWLAHCNAMTLKKNQPLQQQQQQQQQQEEAGRKPSPSQPQQQRQKVNHQSPLGGLEPPTLRLTAARSNQLSHKGLDSDAIGGSACHYRFMPCARPVVVYHCVSLDAIKQCIAEPMAVFLGQQHVAGCANQIPMPACVAVLLFGVSLCAYSPTPIFKHTLETQG